MQCLEFSLFSPFFRFGFFFFLSKLEISWMLGLNSEMVLTGNCSFTDIKVFVCVCVDMMTEVLFLQDIKNTVLICALGISKK